MNIYRKCLILLSVLLPAVPGHGQSADFTFTSVDETDLDGTVLVFSLNGCSFYKTGAIDPDSVFLYDAPSGLSVASVSSGGAGGNIELAFTPGDFDVDFPYFHIGIDPSVLDVASEVFSDSVNLTANIESAYVSDLDPNTLLENDMTFIEVSLTDEIFVDEENLATEDFNLVNFPTGVSIGSIDQSSNHTTDTKARLLLSFTPGDFDADSTHCKVTIADSVLTYSSDSLGSDELSITANVETATFNAGQSQNLDEYNLDDGLVVLDLGGTETFTGTGDLGAGYFTLIDFPAGASIQSVDATTTTRVEVYIDFTYTDFDDDSANCRISIDPFVLNRNKPNTLYSNTFTVSATNEVPAATIESTPALVEYELDGKILTVNLSQEWLAHTGSFDAGDIHLVDYPTGLSIAGASAVDSISFTVTLANVYNDFDSPYDLKVSIEDSVLFQTTGSPLVSGSTTVTPYVETPAATIVPDQSLAEYTLAGRVLTLTFFEEWFDDYTAFNGSHVDLVNAPAGLTVQSASASDSATATITLTYDTTDFDVDANLGVSIDYNQLIQSGSDLVSNAVTVDAYVEIPVADVTPSAPLVEYWLGSRSLDIEFTDEKFNGTPLTTDHFGLSGAPQGLSIGSLSNVADSSVTVNLDFDDTDFDVSYTNVKVAISNVVLLQTESDSLRTSAFIVTPNIEPVVSSVDIPDQKMKVGDTADVYIYLSVPGVHADSVFELASGDVGGYPLFGIEKKGDDEYWSKFTVTENGNDYYASQDIPVNNLRLDDDPLTGETYNGVITGGNDMIDSRFPVVSSLSVIGSGAKRIGDDVILLISAFEEGLFIEDTSTVNYVPLSESNVVFDEIGGGSYALTYTVEGNDTSVPTGALTAKVYMRDTAGNINSGYPAILANSLSIDATAPVIASVTNTTAADTAIIGSTVTLTVVSDGTDYLLGDQSVVNGTPYDELGFSHAGGGTYEITYLVQEGDPVVTAGNLTASIVLQDAAGNESAPETSILDNDIYIFTQRPTALLTGSDEICLNDTATLYITLTGSPPWTVKYKDADASYFIYDIAGTDYTLNISPDRTMNYQIEEVTDGTGNTNTGQGISLVTVNPLPDVEILNLDPVYAIDVETFTLQGSPAGGTFTGPGVITAQQTFTPQAAGLSGSEPHRIVYAYTDANQCFWADTAEVIVIEAEVTWYFPDAEEFACYIDTSYTIRTQNTSSTFGQFSVPEVTTPGFLVDHGDNSVTIYPGVLDWPSGSSNRQFDLIYKYDRQGVEVTERETLNIEYFDKTRITGMTDTVFCSNEPAIEVFGNKDEGVYTGPGIVDIGGFKFEFDPGGADIGYNTLYYTYTSPYNCVQRDSAVLLVNPTPVSDFTILDTCIFKRPVGDTIRFLNATDTAGLGALAWEWNFGDIGSGLDNLSGLENPAHWYSDPGNWTIKLTSVTTEGCTDTHSETFSFGDKPTAAFGWDTECFTDDPIVFTSETEHTDPIATYRWIISDLAGNEVLNSELDGTQEDLSYKFLARDNYRVELQVESELQCRDNAVDTIYLRPYFENLTETNDYLEDFEGTAAGWIAGSDATSVLESWVFGDVEAAKFPYEPVDGSKAWFTDLVRKDTIEQSWVSSPCFDFSQLDRPMVKLDIKVSSDRDRDGAALQYTTDDGKTWENVGTIEDGSINWYNTFRILNGPGGQGEGWTGDFIFDEDPQWVRAMHELDDLRGQSRVQFRLAYGSDGSSLEDNEGFAFDNMWIGERSRIALIEHFTNSGDEASKEANTRINNLVHNNSLDVIDLQYHAGISGLSDRMNEDNPASPSARALFYGTRDVPYTVLDGGGPDGSMIYDYVETQLDTLDLYTRMLVDPEFSIDVDATSDGGTLNVTVEVEARDTLPDREYILYIAVIEKEISDPEYEGANGETVFQNVVKDMLPSAAGISFIRSWNPGDSESVTQDWTIENVLDGEMLYVVAFVQDAGSEYVYQAGSNDPDLNATSVQEVLAARNLSMLIYPNPAQNEAYIMFSGEPVTGPVEIQVFSPLGNMVMHELTHPGRGIYTLNVRGMARGVYLIRAVQHGRVRGTGRLTIMH